MIYFRLISRKYIKNQFLFEKTYLERWDSCFDNLDSIVRDFSIKENRLNPTSRGGRALKGSIIPLQHLKGPDWYFRIWQIKQMFIVQFFYISSLNMACYYTKSIKSDSFLGGWKGKTALLSYPFFQPKEAGCVHTFSKNKNLT